MTKDELKELIEGAVAYANKVLIEDGKPDLMPIFHLISPGRLRDMVIGTPWSGDEEKEMAVAKVKEMAHSIDAQAVMFSMECWLKVEPAPLTPWHARHQSENWVRPSESPDRREAVLIFGMNKARETVTASLQILRDKPGGRIISLVREPTLDDSKYDSWMFDGMFRP